MPSGSSRVSLYTTRRECAALSYRLINSPSVMSRLTATMSARCTMTSAMRRSCRLRMLRSMVRSMAEKPTSSGWEASSTTCRSSRTDPGFQPNSVRIARVSQFSAVGRSTSPSCTTAGRLRGLCTLSWVGSESVMSVHPFPVRIGIGNAELCENLAFEALHRFGIVVLFVVVADQVQEAVHGEMAQMMTERLLLFIGLTACRLEGDRDIAEHARCVVVAAAGTGRLQRRKRQDVGRLVDAAPVAVERANAGIVGQHHRELGIADLGIGDLGGRFDGAMDHSFGFRLGLPAIGDDENLGDGKSGRHGRSNVCFKGRSLWVQDLAVAGFCGKPS